MKVIDHGKTTFEVFSREKKNQDNQFVYKLKLLFKEIDFSV